MVVLTGLVLEQLGKLGRELFGEDFDEDVYSNGSVIEDLKPHGRKALKEWRDGADYKLEEDLRVDGEKVNASYDPRTNDVTFDTDYVRDNPEYRLLETWMHERVVHYGLKKEYGDAVLGGERYVEYLTKELSEELMSDRGEIGRLAEQAYIGALDRQNNDSPYLSNLGDTSNIVGQAGNEGEGNLAKNIIKGGLAPAGVVDKYGRETLNAWGFPVKHDDSHTTNWIADVIDGGYKWFKGNMTKKGRMEKKKERLQLKKDILTLERDIRLL
jgi:hypothetical protein